MYLIPGGINYCNVIIGAVLAWKPQIIRLQLQFFFRILGGTNYCNVTLRFYMIRDEKGTQTQTFWSGYFPVG